MTEMVEKAARALAACAGARITGPTRHAAADEFGWDPSGKYRLRYVDAHWKEHVTAAHCALETMRDLDQATFERAFHEIDDRRGPSRESKQVFREFFKAAIDAALSSREGGE